MEETGLVLEKNVIILTEADQIKERIDSVKARFVENFLELSALLAEVYNKQIYSQWGYNSFKDYVESSDLDINLSVAYRMVKMVNISTKLGIDGHELAQIRPTKLLEIFSLSPETNEKEIKELLEEGDKNTVDEVKKKVKKAKGIDEDEVFVRFKISKEEYDDIVLPAFENIRRLYGNYDLNDTGTEVNEISDSRCFFIACVISVSENQQRDLNKLKEELKDIL